MSLCWHEWTNTEDIPAISAARSKPFQLLRPPRTAQRPMRSAPATAATTPATARRGRAGRFRPEPRRARPTQRGGRQRTFEKKQDDQRGYRSAELIREAPQLATIRTQDSQPKALAQCRSAQDLGSKAGVRRSGSSGDDHKTLTRKGVSKHRVYEVSAASKETVREVRRRFLGFRGRQSSGRSISRTLHE